MPEINVEIGSLEAASNSASIATNQASIGGLSTDIATIQTDVGASQADIQANTTQILTNSTGIASNTALINTLTVSQAQNASDITTVTGDLAALQTSVTANTLGVSAVSYIPAQPTDSGTYRLSYDSVAGTFSWLNNITKTLTSSFGINSTLLEVVTDGTNDFSWDVNPGETWRFEAWLFSESINATPDLRSRVTAPTGTTGRHFLDNIEAAVSESEEFNTETGNVPLATGTDDLMIIRGVAIVTASGSMAIELRNNAGTTAQSFRAGSFLCAERVA